MENFKKNILEIPILGHVILTVIRAKTAISYFRKPLFNLVKWLYTSKETTNFTYHLEKHNKQYLASLIADIMNIEFSKVMTYFKEIEEDEELIRHIKNVTENSISNNVADMEMRLGRRIGWYAFARILKPKVIIETGVDKGLGACVLSAALMKNRIEGYEGKYYGTDNNPKAGYLFSGEYSDFGYILYGDSIQSLKTLDCEIDLFINDSDHSANYEAEEYETISHKLSDHAIILGDNSHITDKLLRFSLKTNRHFIFFHEKPLEHWYPGAGIGISFRR